MKRTKKFAILLVGVVAILGIGLVVKAGNINSGENFTLEKEQSIDDNAYVTAGNVNVLGNVTGDLLAAGGNINISGTVEKDIIAAGGTVNFQGTSSDDMRVAGGNLNIGGEVAGDLAAAGGTVNIISGSSVGKDLYAAGGVVEVNGDVAGEARIAGGDITINGKISGPVTVTADKLVIGDEAEIEGSIQYSTPNEATISPNAQIAGEVDYQKMSSPRVDDRDVKNFLGFMNLVSLVASLLAGIVLVLVFPKGSNSIVGRSMNGFLKETVRGLVILIVGPVASLALMISLVGFPLGILLVTFLVAAIAIACIFSGILLGVWIFKMWFKESEYKLTWKNAAVGIIVLSIIGFIPVLGWLAGFVLFLSALGSVSYIIYEKARN